MTVEEFRRMALALPETEERMHMRHPDFRVRGKIFATLGYPDRRWAMVKLRPAQQADFVETDSDAFVPVAGGWGRGGATNVRLAKAKRTTVRIALETAWALVAPKALVRVKAGPPHA